MSSIIVNLDDIVNHMDHELPVATLEAIHGVMHAFRSQLHTAQSDAPHELTHMEGKVVHFFARHPCATQSELALHAGRDKGQIARLVGNLKDRGFLEVQADATDLRMARLSLTPQGRRAHQAMQRQRHRLAESACSTLTAAEQRQLLELLGRVQKQLDVYGMKRG